MSKTTPATTPRRKIDVPPKPWVGFPLYWHPRGYWMCKRNGEEWRYEADALKSYDRFKKDETALEEGTLAASRGRKKYLLKDAVNAYLTRQKNRLDDGKIKPEQFAKCRLELEVHLPKAVPFRTPLSAFRAAGPGDDGPPAMFRAIVRKAKGRGPQIVHRHVTIVRAMLNYAAGKKKLMLPPDYGDDFDPPGKSELDTARNKADAEQGERAWSVDELRRMLIAVSTPSKDGRWSPHLYAQILMALFGGFGSDDLSAMPEAVLQRDKGIIKFPRVKNGRQRVCALPKMVWDAIDVSIASRAAATTADAKLLLFRTADGTKCNSSKVKSDDKGPKEVGRNDTIGKNFTRFVKSIGMERPRAGFKTLRAMCRTLMMGSSVDGDLIAVVMGRRFAHPVDDYYIRGDLRVKLFELSQHVERQLQPLPELPKQTRSRP